MVSRLVLVYRISFNLIVIKAYYSSNSSPIHLFANKINMKKILALILGVFVINVVYSQAPFFAYTNYVGAFEPFPAQPWTDNWTDFDPQNASYPNPTVSITSNISSNTTWTSNNVYLIDDQFIYVRDGATLTIEPGTIIRGTGKGTLIIERGSKIHAQGTASKPIIFTSAAPVGMRDYGDWGGVVICGAARHNLVAGPNAIAEGGIGDANAGVGVHGGNNDDDNSGVLSYVRIEFPGISLTANSNSEINGLSMYSVGRQTKIDHIQVSYSGDDSFEWFGGSVDAKYLVAFRGWDDDFDTDNGYRGRVQFAVSVRDPEVADQSGSNGFESDNDSQGTLNSPLTAPVFSNVTIIGPNYTGSSYTTASDYKRALHIRRNSSISVYNSIFTGYPDAGLLLDSRRTVANYCNQDLVFKGNLLAGNSNVVKLASNSDTLCISNTAALKNAVNTDNDTLVSTDAVQLVDAFNNNLSSRDLRPTSGSIASSGAVWDFINVFFSEEELIHSNSIEIYPNPASNFITIKVEKAEKIQILDLTGRQMWMEDNLMNDVKMVDISKLPVGVYIVKVESLGEVWTNKIVKQ